MRITSKGQVTIPADIREKAGLLPHTEVEFAFDGEQVVIRPAAAPARPGRGRRIVTALRGSATEPGMTPDEILAMFRGPFDDVEHLGVEEPPAAYDPK